MLARYANMRVTDETLYYAEKRGYANPIMLSSIYESTLAIFPSPITRFFGYNIDKNNLEYSRGDVLYGKGFGMYRVTSHIGDGLATFSWWYYPIQFCAFVIIFLLLNTFTFFTGQGTLYAPFALVNTFTFLGMFRNAGGIYEDIYYMLRGYWQGVVTYLIIYHMVRFVLKFN